MTAYDDWPTAACFCGISIHDYPGARRMHEDRWHSPEFPAIYRLFDQRGNKPQEIDSHADFYARTTK